MLFFRKAILLVHGFAGGVWDYEPLANYLQLYIDFDVYTFTLPGHDKTLMVGIKKEDWEHAVEKQVEALIDRGYKKIYVIGHSMGGVLACHVAAKYPEIKKLVLVAPAFKYLVFKNDKLQIGKSLSKIPIILKDYKQEEVIGRILKTPLNVAKQFMILVKEHENDPVKVKIPTLIIQGKNDNIVPMDSSTYVYKKLNSKVKVLIKIAGVTHDSFKGEHADIVFKSIAEFLKYPPVKSKVIDK